MSGPEEGGGPAGSADALFSKFLREQKDAAGFDDFLRENPEQANALRMLHSLWIAGDLPPGDAKPGQHESTHDPGSAQDALKAFANAPSSAPGTFQENIPGFRLIEVLGEGGFGIVWRAEQERPIRRTVAVKVIKLGMDTRETVARFEAERQALALMSHPGIARVFDAGATERGRPYFVMEFIRGEPITSFCDHAKLGVEARLGLFLTVCEAVEHAHQKGVIHRDLKPSNVLVSLENEKPLPKVIDFGIAKAIGQELTEHTLRTEMGQVIGTPAYMSPEQADSTRLDVDTRSDIYSLGVLLYELVAGEPPFARESFRQKSLDEVLRFVREEEPNRPSTRLERRNDRPPGLDVRRLRGDLDWIVLKAMAKDRDRRYQTVSALAEDIRRHLRHEPVMASPPSLAYRLRKLLRKHRGTAILTSAVAACVLGALGFFAYRRESEFRQSIRDYNSAILERRLDIAQSLLTSLQRDHFARREVHELEPAVLKLKNELESEESSKRLAGAEQDWKRLLALQNDAEKILKAWEKKRQERKTHDPPWRRAEEYEIYARWESAARAEQDLYESATAAYQRAIDAAPGGSEAETHAKRALASAYKGMLSLADRQSGYTLSPDFFQRRGRDLDPVAFSRRDGTVRISTDPPGADVYCFRHEEHEKRLLPLPFDPRRATARVEDGLLRGPQLVVEQVLEPGACPFEQGDRLVAIDGAPLSVEGDLARAIEKHGVGATLETHIQRSGREITISWTPFPALTTERDNAGGKSAQVAQLTCTREQLGFVLVGYPLDFLEECRLGRTLAGSTLDLELPDGSYLLVLRLAGHMDTRFPLRVARSDSSVTVRLLPAAEAPPGYLYVPAGPFTHGGDRPIAFQDYPLEQVDVDGFLMARHEVTFEEYLEFLNDPGAGVDADGTLRPTQKEAIAYLRQRAQRDPAARELLYVLPSWDSEVKDPVTVGLDAGGKWKVIDPRVRSLRFPVFGVSRYAAEEYAGWLSSRAGSSLVSRYRLPTDDEWEKAARGVDRRCFVWGNYPQWSYCWTHRGIHRDIKPEIVGFVPTDESVFGVRDLAGSLSEHALGQPQPPYRFSSIRGGNWTSTDENYGRAASRNGLPPWGRAHSTGFRLVAELKPAAVR